MIAIHPAGPDIESRHPEGLFGGGGDARAFLLPLRVAAGPYVRFLGEERTSQRRSEMSAFDPKRTSTGFSEMSANDPFPEIGS
jgi:hypothetical protein